MKQNLAILLICLMYLCTCTGLSLGDGSDMTNNGNTWQDATLLNLQINGTNFNDLNGDGLRTGDEAGLSGWTIILKTNGMDYIQSTTDNIGRYSFGNLSPGIYTVSENSVTGWNQTSPGNGVYEINLVDKDAINYDFGNHYGPVESVQKTHPIMPGNAWLVHSQGVKRLMEAQASNATNIGPRANLSFPALFSLLSHVPYVPSERDQGNCGNCWVWGCTAPIEVANYFQNGVSDRLSIQYFDSNYNGGSGSWACCGGWEGTFTDFYSSRKKFIPWSNANANYHDGSRGCGGSAGVPASSISMTHSYPITSIQWHLIPTRGTGITQDQAINNIKTVLNQNKAVTMGFYLPDFNPFFTFWDSSSGVWNPDLYCGLANGAYPGGHEVTIVGYNDTSSSNHYWIVLNSWGNDNAHPDGTFKMDMHMNYACSNIGSYSYDFGYFDVAFSSANRAPNTPKTPYGPNNGSIEIPYIYVTSANDSDGDQVKYTFDWRDGTTESQTNLVNSGSNASASHTWNMTGTYQVRAHATDSKGGTSGWSDATNVTIDAPFDTPPEAPLTPIGPGLGFAGIAYAFVTSATDADGDQVKYTFDWGDGTAETQTNQVNSGSNASASHTWNTVGTYQIKALATDRKGVSSVWSNATTIAISVKPNTPPNVPTVPTGTITGTIGTSYAYVTSATDPDGDRVRYTFDWGDGTAQSLTGQVNSGSSSGAYHSWSFAGTYHVKAFATDSKGATSGWSNETAVVMNDPPNLPPNTPSKPYGSATGKAGTSYSYTTYAADPNRDMVLYTFDWGDGTTSETGYVASGTQAAGAHIWENGGTYQVKALANDSKGANSGWSAAKTVIIVGNSPPRSPAKPTGLALGKTGTSYSYATYAADPDGDRVLYTFDWGDGTTTATGYVASGTRATVSHAWSNGGTYLVKAMATDSKGANSGWSSPMSVVINTPPNSPNVPSGPSSGIHGTYYTYTASASDADGGKVKCTFDWGDGTIFTTGLVNSGTSTSASHKWIRATTYQVKAKATDSQGASSGWSGSLSVKIT